MIATRLLFLLVFVAFSSQNFGWEQRFPISGGLVVFANGQFLAGTGNGQVFSSRDGIQWAFSSSLPPGWLWPNFLKIVEGKLYASFGSSLAVLEENGTWNEFFWIDDPINPEYFKGLTFGNRTYVASTDRGNILHSENRIDWNAATAPFADHRDLTFANGVFVAVGSGAGGAGSIIVLLQTELEKPGDWLRYKATATESKL